jgi:hypothetical protein
LDSIILFILTPVKVCCYLNTCNCRNVQRLAKALWPYKLQRRLTSMKYCICRLYSFFFLDHLMLKFKFGLHAFLYFSTYVRMLKRCLIK